MSNPFQPAIRRRAKLKLAMVGPSGSGKTMGALLLAKGLGKKVALVDTEHGSASLYADKFKFDAINLSPPYTPQKYIDLVLAAEKQGYDVLVIDSLSHVWAGDGGVLDKKSSIDSRGGNQYANWKVPKAEHGRLKDAILQSDIHIISTIRAKQGYAMTEENGKNKVQKVGLDPIAEPGAEYEYSVVFDVAMDHNAVASKDRTGLFDGRVFKINEDTGKEMLAWLEGAAAALPQAQPNEPAEKPSAILAPDMQLRIKRLGDEMHSRNWDGNQVQQYISKAFPPATRAGELSPADFETLISVMRHSITFTMAISDLTPQPKNYDPEFDKEKT